MKLLLCGACSDWVALSFGARDCSCGRSGGHYNIDGDTATIWGPGILFGFSNRAWKPLMIHVVTNGTHGLADLRDMPGNEVLWIYDVHNGKITVLDEKPALSA